MRCLNELLSSNPFRTDSTGVAGVPTITAAIAA